MKIIVKMSKSEFGEICGNPCNHIRTPSDVALNIEGGIESCMEMPEFTVELDIEE